MSRIWLVALFFLNACSATYEKTALKSWDLMRSGKSDEALELYKEKVTRSQDKLLRLMDEGILLRNSGRFAESNQKFFAAAKIIEMNGYVNLMEEATTLLTNERMTTYQGEDFEKVIVHLYLGLNFLAMGSEEAALVETRKVNEIIEVMMSNGRKAYEFNAFARYVGAILFENAGDLNDALVAYRNTLKLDPNLEQSFFPVKVDMLRMAYRLGMDQEAAEWKKKFGAEADAQAVAANQNKLGSIAVLYEAGKSPLKISSKVRRQAKGREGNIIDVAIPVSHYERRISRAAPLKIKVSNTSVHSTVLNDLETTAIRQLKDRMGRVIAKAIATAAVKAGVGVAAGKATNSKEIGALTALALILLSEADTRSWLLLPANYQVARIYLPAGDYNLEFDPASAPLKVSVKPSKTTFVQPRSLD